MINLGVVFGAGCYEARIVVPLWISSPPESLRTPDSGRRFWGFVSTLPLTLLTLASLPMAWHARPRRDWWLAAAIIILVERVATFAYFIPAMIRMQRAMAWQLKLDARLDMWRRLNYMRILLTLLAWLAALRAISLPG